MKILFTGGGTGGHLYPALAVAKKIRETYSGAGIVFAGNKLGMEANLVPQEGFDIEFISSAPFSSNPLKLVKSFFRLSLGTLQALKLISRLRPSVVVGSGGYVSAPVTFAAFLKKVPVVLLEQNTFPGKTNRFVGRLADKICISFEESSKYFSGAKTVLTGNPVRQEVLAAERSEARKSLDIPEGRKCLLITGASQGAKSINDAVLSSLPLWKDKDWSVIHIAGEKHYQSISLQSAPILEGSLLDYRCVPFMKNIYDAYAACDLVVCRAGATTLAEITARGIASLMIPYPFAAEAHQEKNARWLEKNNASLMIPDADVADKLPAMVAELMENKEKTAQMEVNSKKLGKPEALANILKVLECFLSNK